VTISFNVSFDDPDVLYTGYYSALTSNALAAAQRWGDHFVSNSSIEIQIRFDDPTGRGTGSGGSVTSVPFGTQDGLRVFEQGSASEVRTGTDPNGASADILIHLSPNYLINELWLDPDPVDRSAPGPSDKTDAVSVLVHEIGHALAFNGWRDWVTGQLPGDYEAIFDTKVIRIDGLFYFNGANAVAAYGGPVPLTEGNLYHYGNSSPLSGSALVPSGLMNGIVFSRGFLYDVAPLDIAVMKDVGLLVDEYVGFRGDDVISAGSGDDRLRGLEGNDQLSGGAGNDTLTGSAGNEMLRGGSSVMSFSANGARAKLGDLDGDGRADILQTESNGRMRAWRSSGNAFERYSQWGSGSRTQDQFADVSGDARADVVQLHENGNVYVWTSNGAGLNDYAVWGRGARPQDKLADFTGDGRADLAQLHENGNIYVWTSNGEGFNDYAVWGRGSRPQDKLADFSGDGKADVVQLHENGNLYVWISNGAGFNDYSVWGRGSRPTDKLADLTGDGKADVVQLHENGNIYVWTSNGAGFDDYSVWGRGSRPTDQLADVNGDGKADVVQLHENGNIYVWTSNGSGFDDYSVWGRGSRPADHLADVNGDAKSDVVQLHENGNAYVWLSTGSNFSDYSVLGTGVNDGAGNDTFVYGQGFGQDTVRDFEAGPGAGDVLRFDPAVFGNYAAVMSNAADDGQGNTRITYDGSNSVLLEHVRRSQLAADDFTFGVG